MCVCQYFHWGTIYHQTEINRKGKRGVVDKLNMKHAWLSQSH